MSEDRKSKLMLEARGCRRIEWQEMKRIEYGCTNPDSGRRRRLLVDLQTVGPRETGSLRLQLLVRSWTGGLVIALAVACGGDAGPRTAGGA